MSQAFEANFDGLPGPTHNYAGLSVGNLASTKHKNLVSNPKEAALQGLEKMKYLADLGIPQGVFAPGDRPNVRALRRLGFGGSDAEVLRSAYLQAPHLLAAACSASSMWTANAATVSPSADSADGRVHFTPANLCNKFHRSLEPPCTSRILKAMFSDAKHFVHHEPLFEGEHFGDEGAANHTRLCRAYGESGLQLFVYGRHAFEEGFAKPQKFPARQTFEASCAVVRSHLLHAEHTVLIQQNPDAIDAGIFHNDVICVGNQNVLFFHEMAFVEQERTIEEITRKFERITNEPLHLIKVSASEVGLRDVVDSYLFNSQLISVGDNKMRLLVPQECMEVQSVRKYLDKLVSLETPITEVKAFDLRQSMRNGGGPACLRLRVVLNQAELASMNPHVLLNESLYEALASWVVKHYRDRMTLEDLSDPELVSEVRTALDELTQMLRIGSVYDFQRM